MHPATPRGRLGACLAFLLVAPLTATADGLSDLRSVLSRYPADASFAAAASVQAKGKSQEGAGARSGSTSFEVESNREGLWIRIPPTALRTAEAEAEAKKSDPDNPTPTRTAMVALTIFDVIDALDGAAMLLDNLEGATLISQTTAAHGGKPARLLRIKVKPTLAGTRSKFVNEPVIELRVWVDPSGIPVAAERDSNYSASVVVASASNVRKERWEFAVAGDRLYASRSEQEDRASAVGKSVVSSRSMTYVPRATR
ncbi:MAG TPA: hypothetical protein VII32_08630 [Thermoanaerobaculia bacterium]